LIGRLISGNNSLFVGNLQSNVVLLSPSLISWALLAIFNN